MRRLRTACLLRAALVLLRTGRMRMAAVLLEQAVLAAEQEQALAAEETRAKPRARRSRRARP